MNKCFITPVVLSMAMALSAYAGTDMKEITPPTTATIDPISLTFSAGPYYYFTPTTLVGTQYSESASIPGPLNVNGSGLGFIVGTGLHVPLREDYADSFDPKFSFWRVENDNPQPSTGNFVYTGAITNSQSVYGTGFNDGITGGNFKSTIMSFDLDLLLSKKIVQSGDYNLSVLYGLSVGYYDDTINESVSGPSASESGKYDASAIRAGPTLGFDNSFNLPLNSTLDLSVMARLYLAANNSSGSQNATPAYFGSNTTYRNGDSSGTFSPQALVDLKWNLPIDASWAFFVEGSGTVFINTPATEFSQPDYYDGSGPNDFPENQTKFGLMSQTTYSASGDVGFKFSF